MKLHTNEKYHVTFNNGGFTVMTGEELHRRLEIENELSYEEWKRLPWCINSVCIYPV